MINGQHFEELLGHGCSLESVLGLAAAVQDMRDVPTVPAVKARIPVTFHADEPDTERQQSLPTWPAKYSR